MVRLERESLILPPITARIARAEKFKAAGIIVVHKCVQVKHALAAEKMGADIISMVHFLIFFFPPLRVCVLYHLI